MKERPIIDSYAVAFFFHLPKSLVVKVKRISTRSDWLRQYKGVRLRFFFFAFAFLALSVF